MKKETNTRLQHNTGTLLSLMKYLTAIASVLAFCISSYTGLCLSAEPVPPMTIDLDVIPPSTLTRNPVEGLTVDSLYVRFEQTKLDEIRIAMGNGSIEQKGDASESIYWLCYTLPGKDSMNRVWFIAHGEMGGTEHTVNVIQAARVPTQPVPKGCPIPTKEPGSVYFDHRIWLNTTQSDLRKKLGSPSAENADRWWYLFAGKKPGVYKGEQVDYDVSGLIKAQFIQGKVSTIIASQVTSY